MTKVTRISFPKQVPFRMSEVSHNTWFLKHGILHYLVTWNDSKDGSGLIATVIYFDLTRDGPSCTMTMREGTIKEITILRDEDVGISYTVVE